MHQGLQCDHDYWESSKFQASGGVLAMRVFCYFNPALFGSVCCCSFYLQKKGYITIMHLPGRGTYDANQSLSHDYRVCFTR